MSPERWGPPVWNLFHTFAEKIKETSFPIIGLELFNYIYRISSYLPCPDCSNHAKLFLGKINRNKIRTKKDLIDLLYIFHNSVNKRKNKKIYNYEDINMYTNKKLIESYNSFINIYHTKGNMKLLTETFQRNVIMKDLKKWIIQNIKHFDP
jgi:hypothetical protein